MTTQDSNNQGSGDPTATPFWDVNAETMQRRIADDLRQARLSRGIEIREAADALRIRAVYLEALEEGRFSNLPGPTYVAGFLRTYGASLGMDGEELVRRYKDDTGGVLTYQQLNFPVPASEARQPTATIILITLILGLAIFAAWYVYKEGMLIGLERVPEVPESIEMGGTGVADAGLDEPDETAVAEILPPKEGNEETADGDAVMTGDGDSLTGPDTAEDEAMFAAAESETMSAISAQEPAADEGVVGAAAAEEAMAKETMVEENGESAPLAEVAATAAAVSESAGGESGNALAETEAALNAESGYIPRIYGRTNTDFRVELRAIEETWIQVEVADDEILLTRVLLPGDVYRVPNRSDVMLDTGNAGGLEVKVDGQAISPLGESGIVVRNISLSADNLLSR